MARDPHQILFCVTSSVSTVFFEGQMRFLQQQGWSITLAASSDLPGQLESFGRTEGILVHSFRLDRDIHLWADAHAFVRAVKLFLRTRPTISNVGTPKAGLVMGLAAALTRVPVRIYTLHGLRLETATGRQRRILRIAERLAMASAHTIVCVSPSLRDEVIKLGLANPNKLVVNGAGSVNGVLLPPMTEPKHTRPGSCPVIGFVGRLTHDKGVEDLVAAFETVTRVLPNARLLLIGSVDETDPLSINTMEAISAESRIDQVGPVSDVSQYYEQMDVLALPTFREGLPLVLLEGAAHGLPTVATCVTGSRDAFVAGRTGWEVSTGNPQQIADVLLECLSDPLEACTRGEAGRVWVGANFSRQSVWDRWNQLYSDSLDAFTSKAIAIHTPALPNISLDLPRPRPKRAKNAVAQPRTAVLTFTEQRTWLSGNQVHGRKPLPIVSALAETVHVRLAVRVGATERGGVSLAPSAEQVSLAWPTAAQPFTMVRAAAMLVRSIALEARKANVIYADQPGVVGGLGLVVGRVLRKPLVVNVVGDANESVHPRVIPGIKGRVAHAIFPRLERWACAQAIYVNYVTSSVLQKRYPPRRAKQSFASTDAAALGPARPRPFPRNQTSIVTVASLEQPYKGISDLIEAISICRNHGYDVSLTVIGEGRLRPQLEIEAKNVAPGIVDFVGYLYGQDLYEELGRHDVFALASWTEGLPRALVEAMADGLPSVATGVGGVLELIETKRIAPARDPVRLADQLMHLLSDEKAWYATIDHNLKVSGKLLRDASDIRQSFVCAITSLAARR